MLLPSSPEAVTPPERPTVPATSPSRSGSASLPTKTGLRGMSRQRKTRKPTPITSIARRSPTIHGVRPVSTNEWVEISLRIPLRVR